MGKHDHPEVSLHSHSLAEYMKYVERDDWAGVAELMLSSADKLAHAGADFLICPDNTIHQAFDLVEHRSPRPQKAAHCAGSGERGRGARIQAGWSAGDKIFDGGAGLSAGAEGGGD